MKSLNLVLVALFFCTTMVAQLPTITSIYPTFGGPGDTILITGTNFSYSTVTGVRATCGPAGEIAFTILSPTLIRIILAVGDVACTGSLYIYYGPSFLIPIASFAGFNWNPNPIIYSVTPSTAGTGQIVKIKGKYLAPGATTPTISFGGIPALSSAIHKINRDTVTVTIGNAAPGDIVLTTILGFTTYSVPIYGVVTFSSFTYENSVIPCANSNSSMLSDITGATYQWQQDAGSGYNNISNGANFSGTTNQTLQLINAPSNWNSYKFRCLVVSNYSRVFTLRFQNIWNGTIDNNWSNVSNWSCNSLPDAGTDVIINSGTINVDVNATIRSLKINSSATLNVNTGNTLTILK